MSSAARKAPAAVSDQLGWLCFAAALLLAQQIASKATRDALFLVSFDPRRLPVMMIAGACASLVAIVLMSRALARWGPLLVLPRVLALSAALYVLEWIALADHPEITAVALYLHVSALGSVLLSGFWTMVSEHRDPHATKRLVGRVAAAAAAGATLGGLLANGLSGLGGAYAMLLALAGTTVVVALALKVLRPIAQDDAQAPDEPRAGLAASVRELVGSRYLRSLAAMSALVAMWQAMLDFAFKTATHGAMPDEASLVAFFGSFYTGTSLLTFVVQTALGKIALRKGGLAATLAVSPLWVALSFTALMGTPFALLAALRGGESVLSNSLLRSAYEVLFTPLTAGVRRATKTLVDVAATRVGDALGSVVVLLLVDRDLAAPLVLAAVLGVLGVWFARRLSRGYVGALTEALEAGVVPEPDASAVDRTTRRTLSETATALDRERVLSGIAALDATGPYQAPAPAPLVEMSTALGARARALTKGTEHELGRALAQPLEPELVRIALLLVAHEALRPRAERAIRAVAPRTVGTLVDALLDPTTPFAVRLRVPRILASSGLPLAVEGLLLGLEDARLEVRMQCARALAKHGGPADHDRVLSAVLREIAEHGATWASATAEPHPDDDDPLSLDVLVRAHASRSLQYVLVLLSVVTEASRLELALEGLSSTDARVRGTALELLDNVVPEPVRAPLLAALDPRTPEPAPPQDRDHVVQDLLRSQEIAIGRVS